MAVSRFFQGYGFTAVKFGYGHWLRPALWQRAVQRIAAVSEKRPVPHGRGYRFYLCSGRRRIRFCRKLYFDCIIHLTCVRMFMVGNESERSVRQAHLRGNGIFYCLSGFRQYWGGDHAASQYGTPPSFYQFRLKFPVKRVYRPGICDERWPAEKKRDHLMGPEPPACRLVTIFKEVTVNEHWFNRP